MINACDADKARCADFMFLAAYLRQNAVFGSVVLLVVLAKVKYALVGDTLMALSLF